MCRSAMNCNTQLSAEVESVDSPNGVRDTAFVQITVREGGEWIGDFFATFTRKRLGGEDKFVADWSDVSGGNGIYVEEQPPFWPVGEAAKELNQRFELKNFEALNTGPNDI